MKRYQPKIEFAYDLISKKQLVATIELKSKSGFSYRNDYADGIVNPICIECGGSLSISGGKKIRPHFRHFSESKDCILSEKNSTQEINIFNEIYKSKESDRHKKLKIEIGEKLKLTKGVSNVSIDDKFITHFKEKDRKKKPDVYCEFNGKKIVFEIQLSNLSNKYIRSRYHFYKENNIFLVWILEDLDLIRENKNTMSLDIKYLAHHQNLFKLNESESNFQLKCSYKDYYIHNNIVRSKWREKSINLNTLNFSTPEYQVFYRNGLQNKEIEEKKLIEIKKKEKQKIEKQKNRESISRIQCVFIQLRNTWENPNIESRVNLSNTISELMHKDLNTLRDKVEAKKKNEVPFFHRLILITDYEHIKIIDVILYHSNEFGFDINKNTDKGKTIIQSLMENKKLNSGKKDVLFRILNSGYRIQDGDVEIVNTFFHNSFSKNELKLLNSMIKLTHLNCDVEELFTNWKFVCLLSSIKENKFIGFNYQEGMWLAFANNAIDNYKGMWLIIEESLKTHKTWEVILKLDKKRSFQIKYENLKTKLPEQDRSLDRLIDCLFPEISSIRWVPDELRGNNNYL